VGLLEGRVPAPDTVTSRLSAIHPVHSGPVELACAAALVAPRLPRVRNGPTQVHCSSIRQLSFRTRVRLCRSIQPARHQRGCNGSLHPHVVEVAATGPAAPGRGPSWQDRCVVLDRIRSHPRADVDPVAVLAAERHASVIACEARISDGALLNRSLALVRCPGEIDSLPSWEVGFVVKQDAGADPLLSENVAHRACLNCRKNSTLKAQ
jgi:hypothetical protein